ncbi:MAG TPA: glycosyltransferase, partial [Thermoanaerobaculia bacterium]
AHDWAGIIGRIRSEVPDACFRFLGTMVTPAVVRRDLGAIETSAIEFVSEYDPDDLPRLLAECTVGAFPSYVEGFGLAVIEQLAAGLPTVAYDTAGPSDILKQGLPECLVQRGDVLGFGAQVCAVLRMDGAAYREQSRRALQIAATFSWRDIARSTVEAYRRVLDASAHPVLFVQPFSLGSAGGGARILRALLEQAPFAWQSICSTPAKPKPWRNELHLRSRPSWGRIEHSRFAALPNATRMLFARGFRRRLKQRALELNASAIHAVAHAGLDFADAHAVARELGLPFFLSVHDDLAYTLAGTSAPQRDAAMRNAWRDAARRFVISDALGHEYSRRYGDRSFAIVTDGLTHLHQPRATRSAAQLRIYFMGLFHMGYEQNLRALLDGLALHEQHHSRTTISVTLRCEYVRPQVIAGAPRVTVLPFADEAQVQRDIEQADLLYMPIPFGDEHTNFARYSLSTKMVTYVGSGVPILYHGPSTSAAFELLNRSGAAIPVTTLAPEAIAAALADANPEKRFTVASNALDLARRDFMLSRQTERFCGGIAAHLKPR